ncbi:hypothetical protein LCGC14_2294010 [marine sediment metagenome]|uniref:Uncharacterized protein n=1 Tax=marine sediment metagenome TaxID=412755 RepID=A0A0F9FKH9_9ZZZZ
MTGTPQDPHSPPNDARRRASGARRLVLRVTDFFQRPSPSLFPGEAAQAGPIGSDRPSVEKIVHMGHWLVRVR